MPKHPAGLTIIRRRLIGCVKKFWFHRDFTEKPTGNTAWGKSGRHEPGDFSKHRQKISDDGKSADPRGPDRNDTR